MAKVGGPPFAAHRSQIRCLRACVTSSAHCLLEVPSPAMPQRRTKRGHERTPLARDCDVLICGASFAGLTVARELTDSGARVLIVDRYEVGERQTSACAAPTEWLDAMGTGPSIKQTFRELVIHTPHVDTRMQLPWTFSTFDYPALCELLFSAVRRRVRDGQGRRTDRHHRAHGPGRPGRAAGRRLPGLAPGPGIQRLPAHRRATVTRARGAPWRSGRRSGDLDRSRLRPGRLQLELSGPRRAPGRGRLLRPALRRQGADRPAGRGPGPRRRPLPGQLDPPQAAKSGRGRRVLRRRLGGALPAADRRGDPHRLLLRNRLRTGAASASSTGKATARRRFATMPPSRRAHRWKFESLLRVQRLVPRVPPRLLAPALRGMASDRFVRWAFGHYLRIAHPAYARELAAPAAAAPARATGRRLATASAPPGRCRRAAGPRRRTAWRSTASSRAPGSRAGRSRPRWSAGR